jgi:hypothetical protein
MAARLLALAALAAAGATAVRGCRGVDASAPRRSRTHRRMTAWSLRDRRDRTRARSSVESGSSRRLIFQEAALECPALGLARGARAHEKEEQHVEG